MFCKAAESIYVTWLLEILFDMRLSTKIQELDLIVTSKILSSGSCEKPDHDS